MINSAPMLINYFTTSSLINALTSFSLCLFVLLKNPRSQLNRSFGLFSFSVGFWAINHFLAFAIQNEVAALFFHRALMAGAIFIPATFFHFVCILLDIYNKKKGWIFFGYALSIFFFLTDFTTLFITSVSKKLFFKYFEDPGPMYHPFMIMFVSFAVYSHYLMFRGCQTSAGARKNQIKYVFVGTLIGFVGGSTSFPLVYNIPIPPVGNCLVSVYIIMSAIAILKYRLMDINIALTRAGIFVFVYLFVLGVPFWLGYKHGLWQYATWLMLILATAGPFVYQYLRRQAEVRLLSEEQHAHQVLTQAAGGMLRFRSIEKLVSLIVHVICKTLKLDAAGVFLLEEDTGEYKPAAVRPRSSFRYSESLHGNNVLIQRLTTLEEPLVYEEVKIQEHQLKDKTDDSIPEIARQMRALSALAILPLMSRDRLLGFLILGAKKSQRMYSRDDLAVLWALAYQAALAIENARLHKKAEEELLKEERELTASHIGHGASHQFKNILNKIMQHSRGKEMDIDELELNNLSQEELKKLVIGLKEEFQAITEKVNQGTEIVSGILSLGAGSPVDFKPADLKAIVQHSLQGVKLKMSKRTAQSLSAIPEMSFDIPDSLPRVWCNSLQIEQVIDNMLDNNLEAIEEKENLIKWGELTQDEPFRGKIRLEAWVNNEHIYLKISDNGIGIKQENRAKIFLPLFSTKDTGRISRKGHGVGMYVIKKIILAHQGKVSLVESEYGKGASFMIEFPLEIKDSRSL